MWIRGLLAVLGCLPACVVRVVPPPSPEQPVAVYVYTDAWHQGLILPHPDGGYVEFSFGESDWFAYDETSWLRLPEVLFHETAGTLAMRRVRGSGPATLDAAYPFQPRFALLVSRPRVDLLREDLTARFAAAPGSVYFDPILRRRQLRCDDQPYWLGYNCCDALREWLMQLGCAVTWAPWIRRLVVQ